MTATLTLSALGHAALCVSQETGLAVFPLHEMQDGKCTCRKDCSSPGKHPRTANGFRDAATHPEQIGEWWDRWPTANIGAVPGSIDCVVIDSDGEKGEPLARSLGVFEASTCETITSRGMHRWFRLPRGMVVGNIARTELDVRSSAGYVIVPPSVHPSGHVYQWRGSLEDVADAPNALAQWLARGGREERETVEREHQRQTPAASTADGISRRVLRYAEAIGYRLADGRKTAAFRRSSESFAGPGCRECERACSGSCSANRSLLVERLDLDPRPHDAGDSTRWDYLTKDGKIAGRLVTPPKVFPRLLDGQNIFAVVRDENDVPQIVRYSIAR